MKLNKLIIIICFCAFISIAGGFVMIQRRDTNLSDLYTLTLEEEETYKLTVKNKQGEMIFQEQYVGEPRIETIYDKDMYYMEIIRDFSPEAIPYKIILKAELSDSQLILKYYSGENWKVVKETINL